MISYLASPRGPGPFSARRSFPFSVFRVLVFSFWFFCFCFQFCKNPKNEESEVETGNSPYQTLARGKIAAPGALDAFGLESPVTSGFADRRGAFPPQGWRQINFSGFLPARPPFGL
jgi:hypothetical protein